MSYSVVTKDSLSDEYGHLVLKDPEDPEELRLELEPILSSSEEEEEEEEPSRTCCHCHERMANITMANVTCFIVLIEIVVFAYWIVTYDYAWTRDLGRDQESSGPGLESSGPGLEEESDYSFLSARLSRITEGGQDKDQSRYNNTTYVGKSADEFIEFLGIMLLIYLFIKCVCGPSPQRK